MMYRQDTFVSYINQVTACKFRFQNLFRWEIKEKY